MPVRIRLRRVGRKKQPSYRIVVANSEAPRDGAYLDTVGFYNPLPRQAELRVDLEKVDEWLGRGAQMTETAASLVRKARSGGDERFRIVSAAAPGSAALAGGPEERDEEPAAGATVAATAEPEATGEEVEARPEGEPPAAE